ncbi:hypothetical protein [Nocardia seriolae]|uniref:ECF subfamily RNA polymerase sigma-70 factor n=1 Tax=Nocardia seriolae TaxID=37332 RepID=A0A0B8N5M3_9NOCA|nr:hypothetical protein [Nocardia seriolae]APB00103.1 hypothetical protein NS506_06066 [Nocardia seriolae]MTJ64775.1 hypothetical protein [Nocardia seriolae]MTJ72573.1 hypothetical protein [Nocardia seriolae]MTJ89614.1 hypothetical protein [Nocardia seriolae]MTK33588.1 hypothetical protein [Nocardia seriolae]
MIIGLPIEVGDLLSRVGRIIEAEAEAAHCAAAALSHNTAERGFLLIRAGSLVGGR